MKHFLGHHDTQHNGLICDTQLKSIAYDYAECRYVECRYAECCYAECRDAPFWYSTLGLAPGLTYKH